ncbi:MAG: hypothetical protein LBH13_09200 [Cellulomonadaceae bacterium]|jgi:hypothetical protein|nr:hypothetical protein [Cellulomonadaceae bacterium]
MNSVAKVFGGLVVAGATTIAARRIMQGWGVTVTERADVLPGDDLIPDATVTATRGVDIAAPPAAVYPWIVQLGYGKAGFYSFDVLEQAIGLDITSADVINPAWQDLSEGDAVSLAPQLTLKVASLEQDHFMVLAGIPGDQDTVDQDTVEQDTVDASSTAGASDTTASLGDASSEIASSGTESSSEASSPDENGLTDSLNTETGPDNPPPPFDFTNTAAAPPPFDFTWAFVVLPAEGNTSRLMIRERYRPHGVAGRVQVEAVQAPSFVMSAKMLSGIKKRAEGPA